MSSSCWRKVARPKAVPDGGGDQVRYKGSMFENITSFGGKAPFYEPGSALYRLPSTTLIFPQSIAEISSLLQQEEDNRSSECIRISYRVPSTPASLRSAPSPAGEGLALKRLGCTLIRGVATPVCGLVRNDTAYHYPDKFLFTFPFYRKPLREPNLNCAPSSRQRNN